MCFGHFDPEAVAYLETLELRGWSKRGGGTLACRDWGWAPGSSGPCPFVYTPSAVSSRGDGGGI